MCWPAGGRGGTAGGQLVTAHDVPKERGTDSSWGSCPLLPSLQANKSYHLLNSHVLGTLLGTLWCMGAVVCVSEQKSRM